MECGNGAVEDVVERTILYMESGVLKTENKGVYKKNNIFILALISALFAFLFVIFYKFASEQVRVYALEDYKRGIQGQFSYAINDVNQENGRIEIEGYATEVGKEYEYYDFGIDKHDKSVYNNNQIAFVNNNIVYALPTRAVDYKIVNGRQNDKIEYRYCGFHADLQLTENFPHIPNGNYKIAVIVKNMEGEQFIIDTDKCVEVRNESKNTENCK